VKSLEERILNEAETAWEQVYRALQEGDLETAQAHAAIFNSQFKTLGDEVKGQVPLVGTR
jgi:Zn/Cd-binding protein ZinT